MGKRASIGFIVEGTKDKATVEALAARVLPEGTRTHCVRLGGKAALRWAYETVYKFLDADYDHVVMVVDADTRDAQEAERAQQELEDDFRRHGVSESVTVCMAVPTIEAWLLAGYEEEPEAVADPKEALTRVLGGATREATLEAEQYVRVVEGLELERARERSPSLGRFLDALRTQMERFEAPASGRQKAGRRASMKKGEPR